MLPWGILRVVGSTVLLTVGGLALVVGGIAFRRRSEVGRRMLLFAVVVVAVVLILSIGFRVTHTLTDSDPLWVASLRAVWDLALNGLIIYLLWRALVFLRSPSVVDLCSHSDPPP